MVRDAIQAAVGEALEGLGCRAHFSIEYPKDYEHGDYATNAALLAAKEMGKRPIEAADFLKHILDKKEIPGVASISIAGPGFLNFTVTPESLAAVVKEASQVDEKWGKGQALKKKEVLVEYTSPNLFKPLHIGNLIGNILGESLSRLLEYSGAKVLRVNYPSDIGLTVAKGVWGLSKLNLDPTKIEDLGRAYVAGNAAYEDGSAKDEIEAVNRALYDGSNKEWNALRKKGIETSRRHLDALCEKLGTVFDKEFFESETGPIGAELVRNTTGSVFEESDGAVVYRGEQEGLHTRVFLNSQGLPTYEAKDVGLLKRKLDTYPKFDISITDTGPEQKEYFKVMFAAARKLFPKLAGKELVHTVHGYLKLTTGKMSSRLGNVITGESLLAELMADASEKMRERNITDAARIAEAVAVGALKYAVLKQGSGRDILFDPEKAFSLEGDSGPYLQYAHTRAVSLLRKAKEEGVKPKVAALPEVPLVLRLIPRFPHIVARAALEREPHFVTTYLTELAGAFNSWYGQGQIVSKEDPYSPAKVALVDAFRVTMRNGLHVLGMQAPERM